MLTMSDQAFASVSNFAVGVVVAHIAGAAGLGAFSLAYTCWILLTNAHRALITDPMAILGDLYSDDASQRVRQGLAAEVLFGLVASAGFLLVGLMLRLAGAHTFADGILALAPWIVFLNIQDYWRWIGFMSRRPEKSIANDAVFDIGEIVAFGAIFLVHAHSAFSVISAWGFGAAVGAVYGLKQFSVRPGFRGGARLLLSRWHLTKWLASSSLTGSGATSLYVIIAGAVLGPTGLGGLKAAQALVWGPSAIVMQGGTSFGLPEASRALTERGWQGLRRVSRWVAGMTFATALISAVVVFFAGKVLLKALYGPAFSAYEPAAELMAIGFMISALTLAPTLTLKAAKRTRWLLNTQLVLLVSTVSAVAALALKFGVTGAAWASVVSALVTLGASLFYQSRAAKEADQTVPDAKLADMVLTGEVPA
jgi:O-antigen/teichoic acid export membrane protein